MARAQHGAGARDSAPGSDPEGDGPPSVLFTCSVFGTVLAVTAELGRLSGRPLAELPGIPVHALLDASSHERLQQVMRAARDGATSGSATLGLRHADGSCVEVGASWSVLAGAGRCPTHLVFFCADPSAGRVAGPTAAVQPRAAELRDGLTQLPNRTLLSNRLAHALTRAQRSTAILLVDLDHFRMVNESRGHVVGDALLVGVGARLRAAVPGHETVARFGGDEFVVVCENTDEHGAHAVARELLRVLSEPVRIDGAAVHVAASIGVAVAPAEPAVSATDLLRHAETAVHAAKSAGRGRVQVFDPALGDAVELRYGLSADLRAALVDEALHLEYQPVVDLASGSVVGLEALARWTHPERGPVPPSSFVTVAEHTGLALKLDSWVVQQALRDMAALRAAGVVPDDAYLSVNLSAANLTDAFVFDDLLRWTQESGLPTDQLVLEITETAIMQNADVAGRLLRMLCERGLRVAMDDFGTGYGSLTHLRDLPISALKIDRSFVADIADQQGALAIVASIVDLARAVGVGVVAEGVQTPEQAARLRRLGVVTAQGWLWSPAVPVRALLSGREWLGTLAGTRDVTSPARRRRWTRDVSVAHGLRRLLDLYHDGAPVASIAAALNAEGFRTPAGLRWHRTSVARVIAHQIRRSRGTPDSCSGVRGAPWPVPTAGDRTSRLRATIGRPSVALQGETDTAR